MNRRSGIGTAAVLIAAFIFGAAMLLSLITGAGVYRQVQDRVDEAAAQRLGLTYITAKLHAKDEAHAVDTIAFGDGDALILRTEIGGSVYETLLYVSDGWLRELLQPEGQALSPDAGQNVTQAQSLHVRREGQLLRIEYLDAQGKRESMDVFLRSEG